MHAAACMLASWGASSLTLALALAWPWQQRRHQLAAYLPCELGPLRSQQPHTGLGLALASGEASAARLPRGPAAQGSHSNLTVRAHRGGGLCCARTPRMPGLPAQATSGFGHASKSPTARTSHALLALACSLSVAGMAVWKAQRATASAPTRPRASRRSSTMSTWQRQGHRHGAAHGFHSAIN